MSHSSEYQRLLSGFSHKEINILQRHSDLIVRLREISKIDETAAKLELREEYDLEIDEYLSEDCTITTEKLEDAIPKWFSSNHCGWFMNDFDGNFLEWARNFLAQEVRMNIWLRYLEHKKKYPHYGSYGHPGSYI